MTPNQLDAMTQTTLRLLDQRIATRIQQATDDVALWRFASACAEYALRATKLSDATLEEAARLGQTLNAAQVGAASVAALRQRAEAIAERLDAAAFDAQDALDAGQGTREAYEQAFAQARAATSALRCLNPSARSAAADACYEAFHATNDTAELLRLANALLP